MKNGFYRDLQGRLRIKTTPGDNVDYTLDYIDEFAVGESVSTSTWSVPAGVTKGADGRLAQTTTVTLRGGAAGASDPITNTVLTSAGRTFVRTFWLDSVQYLS
jgi:hypothetical protein